MSYFLFFTMNKTKRLAHCDDPSECLKCICDGWLPANGTVLRKRIRRIRRKRERLMTLGQMELEKVAIEEIKKTQELRSNLH